MIRSRLCVALAVLGSWIAQAAFSAEEGWPNLLGPRQALTVTPQLGLVEAEGVGFQVAWRRPFGSGYAAVVTAEGVAVSTAMVGAHDVLEAFDPATGERRWHVPLGNAFLGRSGSDDGPLSTPVLHDGTVFALTPRGEALAIDLADGSVRWRRDLATAADAVMPTYGFSSALLVAGDALVVPVGAVGSATIAGLDLVTGALRWTAGTDGVGYQNPILVTIAGHDHIVIAGNEHLWGIDPAGGTVLWQHALGFRDDSGHILKVEGDRLLFTGTGETSFVVEVRDTAGALGAERIWEAARFKRNHGIPIHHDGHLYGFDGAFLTCVRASDGEMVWRSRPPRAKMLTLIDDTLFAWASDGDVVAIEATSEGYRERGRAKLAKAGRVYTPLTYSHGALLLGRDLHELVAVRIEARGSRETAEATVADVSNDDTVTRFLGRLETTPTSERDGAVARFLAEHPRLPIVTDAGRAHFLFQGAVDDLALQGDMTGRWPEHPMRRVEGTDLFHRSYPIRDGQRWEYRFKVFDESRLDPANPEQVEGPDGTWSVVTRGTWSEPDWAVDGPRGTIERIEIEAPEGEEPLAVQVYMPAGYAEQPDRRYPLALFALGEQATTFGRTVALLDSGSGHSFAPVVAAFLELPDAMWWDHNAERFAELMTTRVIPELDARFRLLEDRASRAMVTRGWSTRSTLLLAFDPASKLGNLALQSPLFGRFFLDRELARGLEGLGSDRRVALWADWGVDDGVNTDWPADVPADTRALAERFRQAGQPVTTAERPGGHSWTSWRTQTAAWLATFFPVGGGG